VPTGERQTGRPQFVDDPVDSDAVCSHQYHVSSLCERCDGRIDAKFHRNTSPGQLSGETLALQHRTTLSAEDCRQVLARMGLEQHCQNAGTIRIRQDARARREQSQCRHRQAFVRIGEVFEECLHHTLHVRLRRVLNRGRLQRQQDLVDQMEQRRHGGLCHIELRCQCR
jgi:hypothetical protein